MTPFSFGQTQIPKWVLTHRFINQKHEKFSTFKYSEPWRFYLDTCDCDLPQFTCMGTLTKMTQKYAEGIERSGQAS
jgi:hypothetical protein